MAVQLRQRDDRQTKGKREQTISTSQKSTSSKNQQYTEHVFEVQYSSTDSLLRALSYITFTLFVGLFLIQLHFLWNTYMLLHFDAPTHEPRVVPALPSDLFTYYSQDDLWHIEYLNGQLRVNTTLFVC